MKHPVRIAAVALAVVGGATTMVAAPAIAGAAPVTGRSASLPNVPPTPTPASKGSPTLGQLKAKAAAAISSRLNALHTAIPDVNNNRDLTSRDKSSLVTIYTNDINGLSALATKIQSDTTLSQAKTDFENIFLNFRVYWLGLPQGRLTATSDRFTGTVLPKLVSDRNRLAALLAGPDASKNTAAVQAAMADLSNRIQDITTATNGLSTQILGFTPHQLDANLALLDPARGALKSSRSNAQEAKSDIKTVIAAIR